ncbi:MAG: hypothetical protein LBT98_02495 [Puniceicoccales bacterium]|nr:hypothetical protein [Puniceicoccales bacterium]
MHAGFVFSLAIDPILPHGTSMGGPTYGDVARWSIAEFSVRSANAGIGTGMKVFFAATKILELLAIPPLLVIGFAWAPLGLPLLGLAFAMGACGGRSRLIPLAACAIWPLIAMDTVLVCVLTGPGDGDGDAGAADANNLHHAEPRETSSRGEEKKSGGTSWESFSKSRCP